MNSRLAFPVGALALILTLGVGFTAFAAPGASRHESCTVVLGGEVCSWIVMDGDRPTELGATIPMTVIDAAPSGGEMVWPPEQLAAVVLPAPARKALGVDHLALNWEAHGHPPAAFLTEHFDFHFYNIDQTAVQAIDCSDVSKPDRLPARYTLPDIEVPGMGSFIGLCVPHMGMHALVEDEMAGTEPFEASMVIGYYAGEPVFFEPMVAREKLRERADFTLPMPVVRGLPEGVRYPTRFRAQYDGSLDAYHLIFTGFDGA